MKPYLASGMPITDLLKNFRKFHLTSANNGTIRQLPRIRNKAGDHWSR